MKLRDYQIGTKEGIAKSLRAGNKKIIVFGPTGMGKTVIAVSLIEGALKKGNRCWFVVDSIELINQAWNTMHKFGIDAGILQGHHELENISKPVQVMTAQTLTKRWKKFDRNPEYLPDMVIIDEAHQVYVAHTEIFDGHRTADVPVFGFSATPYTRGLGKLYDDMVIETSTKELTEAGHLVPVISYGCKQVDTKGLKADNKGDWSTNPLAKRATKITGDIVSSWLKLGEGRPTLVYCVNIAHSKEVCDAFLAAGINAKQLDGHTDKTTRKDLIEAFKQGSVNVLTSVGTLVKGFDAPIASCAIIARPTKSKMLHFQILGRVLRLYPGKENALILDHGGNIERLGFPDENIPVELDDGTKGNSADRAKKEDKKKTECPKCHQIMSSLTCLCGFVIKPKSNVEVDSGELKKLSPAERRNKTIPSEDKQAFFSGALQYCYLRGKKEGYAANLYKSRFGVWPNHYNKVRSNDIPIEVINQVKANNIRFMNSKYRR